MHTRISVKSDTLSVSHSTSGEVCVCVCVCVELNIFKQNDN